MNTGNGHLYLMVSALLGCLIVSGLLGRENLFGVKVLLDFSEEIHAGRETTVRIRLENRRRFLPLFLLQVEVADSSVLFPVLSPGEKCFASAVIRFPRRGMQHLGTVRIRSVFPVDFFLRWRDVPVNRQVIVFPAPRAFVPPGMETAGPCGSLIHSRRGHEGELDRIADYRGEPLKYIHWKLSARQEDLKVKILNAATETFFLIDPERLPGESLEERLQHGSFLVDHFLGLDVPLGMKIANRLIPPGISRAHRTHLLTELALYGTDRNRS